MKTCKRCGGEFSINDFYVHKQMADGHLNFCKLCVRKRVGKHKESNLDKIQEYDRNRGMLLHRVEARLKYSKTDKGKQISGLAKKKWIKTNPRKRKAEVILGNHLRANPSFKLPCESCGTIEKVHGHHENYDKPLEVKWLCAKHHKDRHREMKELGIVP